MPTYTNTLPLLPSRKRAFMILRAEWVLFWAELATLIGVCVFLWLERIDESKSHLSNHPIYFPYNRLNKIRDQLIVSACIGSCALMINLTLNVLLRQGLVLGYGRKCLTWIWIRSGLLIIDFVVTILIMTICFNDSNGAMVAILSVSFALYVYRGWSITVINRFVNEFIYPSNGAPGDVGGGDLGRGIIIPLNNLA